MTESPIDLPDGFDDAPADVQQALLERYPDDELTAVIADEIGFDRPTGAVLPREHKAALVLRLRGSPGAETSDTDDESDAEVVTIDGGVVIDADPVRTPTEPEDATKDPADRESDTDHVQVCPECDGTTIYERETKPDDERWRCSDCESTFREPDTRPPKRATQDIDAWVDDAPADEDADGEPVAPDADDAETDGDTHRCRYCGKKLDTEAGLARHKGHCRPDWLRADADTVLENAPTSRSLAEIIEIVLSEDDIMGVHTRIDSTTIGQARGGILGPLGLVGPNGDIVGREVLDDRLSVLSAWTIDGADGGGE